MTLLYCEKCGRDRFGSHMDHPRDLVTPVTYRVPLRSLDSDHTFARYISVYGPRDLASHLEQLAADFPDYSIGTPRPEKAS